MNSSVLVQVAVILVFLFSALAAPWWVTIPLGFFLMVLFDSVLIPIAGGFLMDSVFGAPLGTLGGFSFLYTALFAGLACVYWGLQKTLVE